MAIENIELEMGAALKELSEIIEDCEQEITTFKWTLETPNSSTNSASLEILQAQHKALIQSIVSINDHYPPSIDIIKQQFGDRVQSIADYLKHISVHKKNKFDDSSFSELAPSLLDTPTFTSSPTDQKVTPEPVAISLKEVKTSHQHEDSLPVYERLPPLNSPQHDDLVSEVKQHDRLKISNEIEERLRHNLLVSLKPHQDALLKDIRNGGTKAFEALAYLDQSYSDFLQSFYKKLSLIEKEVFIAEIIPICVPVSVQEKNIFVLNFLQETEVQNGGSRVTEITKSLPSPDKEMAEKLLAINTIKSEYLKNLMLEFIEYGNVTKSGALFLCAQIGSRKRESSYSFQPTILDKNEFPEYLQILQASEARPARVNFTITGSHWISGTIEVNKDGSANLLLSDSLESNAEYNAECIKSFSKAFPSNNIYHNYKKRQREEVSCHMFALDDLRHLFTVDTYLEQNLFDYLRAQNPKEIISIPGDTKEISVNYCHLPLALERSMQTSDLTKYVIPSRPLEEKERAINSKKQTAALCAETDFKGPSNKTPKNTRLNYVVSKFFSKNLHFAQTHSEAEIQKHMEQYNLAAFKERMKKKVIQEEKIRTSFPKGESIYTLTDTITQHGFKLSPQKKSTTHTLDAQSLRQTTLPSSTSSVEASSLPGIRFHSPPKNASSSSSSSPQSQGSFSPEPVNIPTYKTLAPTGGLL